jgi:hypothetical protein
MKTSVKTLVILFVSAFLLYSCDKILMSAFYTTKVSVTDYSNGDKQMRFIGMHHIGKPEYYENVKKTIIAAKNEGYVLFYEWIDFDLATDPEKRKSRKLIGMLPSPEGFEKMLGEFGDTTLIVQPQTLFLNLVNNKDFNIDLTPQEILSTYEDKYGELQLNELDMNTPLTESFETGEPEDQVEYVMMDKRNEHLANKIIASKYSKIIVMYGGLHKKGLIELLKKDDARWGKI